MKDIFAPLKIWRISLEGDQRTCSTAHQTIGTFYLQQSLHAFTAPLQPNCPSKRSCALWNDQCLSETLPRLFWEQSPSHSIPLPHSREKVSAMNHTQGFINLMWCTDWDIIPSPLAVWTAVSPAWHHWPPEAIQVGLLCLPSSRDRHGEEHCAWCPGPATWYFTTTQIDPWDSQFSYLNIIKQV